MNGGSERFSPRFTGESKREGGVEMRRIGADGKSENTQTHKHTRRAFLKWEWTRLLPAMKFEECHSSSVHLKTMKGCTHDCK